MPDMSGRVVVAVNLSVSVPAPPVTVSAAEIVLLSPTKVSLPVPPTSVSIVSLVRTRVLAASVVMAANLATLAVIPEAV